MSAEIGDEVISVTSDQENDEDDVEVIELRRETQDLINNPAYQEHRDEKKHLQGVQCPICFDEVTAATVTLCGHIFCLECIQQSVASSTARGQTRGRRGVGLCPLCRKNVAFKDTVLLRLKKLIISVPPAPSSSERSHQMEKNVSNDLSPPERSDTG